MITIQGQRFKAIFDTGADENMVCSGTLDTLKNISIIPQNKEYTYFIGSKNNTMGKVDLEFEYKGKKWKETFNV